MFGVSSLWSHEDDSFGLPSCSRGEVVCIRPFWITDVADATDEETSRERVELDRKRLLICYICDICDPAELVTATSFSLGGRLSSCLIVTRQWTSTRSWRQNSTSLSN